MLGRAAAGAGTFHGLTGTRMAILAGFALTYCFFNWPVAVAVARGLPLELVVQAFLAQSARVLIFLFGGVITGVAVYNRAPGSVAARLVAAGVAIGAVGWAMELLSRATIDPWKLQMQWNFRAVAHHLFWIHQCSMVGIAVVALVYVTHCDDVERSVEAESLRAIDLERGFAEARLQVTQAQIEPHFLFNTLANIRRLYQVDAVAAGTMLRQFSRLLDHSLPQLRDPRSTVGREVALALAYLDVQKIRMGDRLSVATDIPSSLDNAALPPMMLSTLVENAIKHGLAPLRRGGRIEVSAEADGAKVRIRVVDNGRGLCESTGTGVGLANIATRLSAMFGSDGSLALEANEDGGVTAVLELPLRLEAMEGRDAAAVA